MIELAPNHKIGLNISSPVMIASGFCGYGDAYQRLVKLSMFGAVVTHPITLRPQRGQRGTPHPRVVETPGGILLDTGQQNPGIKQVLRRFGKIWSRLDTSVIAHLPADEPDDLRRTARALYNSNATVAAIELGIPNDAVPQDIAWWIRAIRDGCEFPLLAKIPFGASAKLVNATVRAHVDALVVAAPPPGAFFSSKKNNLLTGYLYGPALHSIILHYIQETVANFNIPLIASGGIYTAADARAYLASGADAVQIDSVLFADPKQAEQIANILLFETGD